MSSRKRPLVELSQPHTTPSRYAPSTPHAIHALQQRSGAKNRSLRSVRHAPTDTVRPNSIRGVLRQFAKISAPVTNKRIATPNGIYPDKENRRPNNEQDDDDDNDNDSILLKKPNFTFAIEESVEEDDSELLVAPTPSVLPDDGDDDDQPTTTFHNVTHIPLRRPTSERSDRRRSRLSLLHSEPMQGDEQDDQDADWTIMSERGRRAMSEDATGRLSRYSFGNFRMSDFGSELEIRREPDEQDKTAQLEVDEYMPVGEDDSMNNGDTENLRHLGRSLTAEAEDDTVQLSAVGDETFRLELPEEEGATAQEAHTNPVKGDNVVAVASDPDLQHDFEEEENSFNAVEFDNEAPSRRQTLLESSTTKSHATRRKRVKLTRHGTTVPSLPTSLIKRVVHDSYEKDAKRKPKLGRDHMKALEQATEWFFEQVGEDLAAYSSHGRRKRRVDTDDALLLMKRQRVLSHDGELQRLARGWLPKDVLSELDLPDTI